MCNDKKGKRRNDKVVSMGWATTMTDAIDHFDEHDDIDEAANLSVRDKIKYFSGGSQNHDEMQIADDEMIMAGNYEDQELANGGDDEMIDQANLSVRDKIQYFGGRNQSSNRSGIRQTKHQTLVPKPIEYVNRHEKLSDTPRNRLQTTNRAGRTISRGQSDFVELFSHARAAPDIENSKRLMIGVIGAFRCVQQLKAEASNHYDHQEEFDDILTEMKMFHRATLALKTAMVDFGINNNA